MTSLMDFESSPPHFPSTLLCIRQPTCIRPPDPCDGRFIPTQLQRPHPGYCLAASSMHMLRPFMMYSLSLLLDGKIQAFADPARLGDSRASSRGSLVSMQKFPITVARRNSIINLTAGYSWSQRLRESDCGKSLPRETRYRSGSNLVAP